MGESSSRSCLRLRSCKWSCSNPRYRSSVLKMGRLTNIRSRSKTSFSWTAILAWLVLGISCLLIFRNFTKNPINALIVFILTGIISRLLFSLPPEDSWMVFKQWMRSTRMTPHENNPTSINYKEIKGIQTVIKKKKERMQR